MEKDTNLRVLNSTASGNPEDHDDSDQIEAVPGETFENDQVEENEYVDNTGVVINY